MKQHNEQDSESYRLNTSNLKSLTKYSLNIKKKQARSTTLQDKLNIIQKRLNNVLKELNQTRLIQTEINRAKKIFKNSLTSFTVTSKQSLKHSDFSVFINEVNFTFDD